MKTTIESAHSGTRGVVTGPSSPVSFECFRTFDRLEAHRDEWDGLVSCTCDNFYATFEWCRTWWEFYGRGRELHILLVRRGETLLAILPIFIETLHLGLVRLKVAKLVGSDYSIQLCNPPIESGEEAEAVRLASDYFLREQRCDLMILSSLSAAFAGFDELADACRHSLPGVLSSRVHNSDVHTLFTLPASFDAYVAGLGKKARANYRRDLVTLAKLRAVEADTVSDTRGITEHFEAFREMHSAQWKAEGKQGHFDDWPQAFAFNLALAKRHALRGAVRLHRVLLDGSPAVYNYGFVFNQRFYWRLPARAVGLEYSRISLGKLGLGRLIESSIGEGVHTVEGGQGHYDYKLQLGATEHAVATLTLIGQRRSACARYRFARLLSRVIDTAYYKIVFRRIYPRARYLARPLSPTWIRTRCLA